MKKLFATVLLSFGLLTIHAQTFTPPAEGKAVIYFIRISGLGSLVDFYYFDGKKYIGKFYGTKYMRYECEPGQHLIWVKAENRDFIEADLEAGKIYLLEPIPQMGMMKAGATLNPIDMTNEKTKTKVMKILTKDPVVFTEAQLAEKEATLQEVITKGIAKYEEEKAAGKTMLKLEKQMFYEPH